MRKGSLTYVLAAGATVMLAALCAAPSVVDWRVNKQIDAIEQENHTSPVQIVDRYLSHLDKISKAVYTRGDISRMKMMLEFAHYEAPDRLSEVATQSIDAVVKNGGLEGIYAAHLLAIDADFFLFEHHVKDQNAMKKYAVRKTGYDPRAQQGVFIMGG